MALTLLQTNPTLISGTQNNAAISSGTSVTVTSTGSVTAGNLMVVALCVGGASAPSALTPPAGWTTSLATIATASGGTVVFALFTKLNTTTASFSGSFTWTTTATKGHWAFMEWTGEGASLLDGSVADTQNASGTKTSPSVTPTAGNLNDTLVCMMLGGTGTTADSLTIPAGMTAISSMATAGTSSVPFFYGASLALSTASATGTKTWTIPTSSTCLGVSFLIQRGFVSNAGYNYDLPPTTYTGNKQQFDLRNWEYNSFPYYPASAPFQYQPGVTLHRDVLIAPYFPAQWYETWSWGPFPPPAPVVTNNPFVQTNWPNPSPLTWYQTWTVSQGLTSPFVQYNWPNPQPVTWYQSWEYKYIPELVGQDKLPNRQQDWPNPYPVQWYKEWVFGPQLGELELEVPFRQSDWPNPRTYVPIEQTWFYKYIPELIGQDQLPNRQQNWPNPYPITWYQSWIEFQQITTPITSPPFLQFDWPLPGTYPRLEQTWYYKYIPELVGQDVLPFRQDDWPNPQPIQWYQTWATWLNELELAVPFRQQDWPTPYPVSWYQNFAFVPPITPAVYPLPTFNQYDWPLPRTYQPIDQFYFQNLAEIPGPPAVVVSTNIYYKPHLVSMGHMGYLGGNP